MPRDGCLAGPGAELFSTRWLQPLRRHQASTHELKQARNNQLVMFIHEQPLAGFV
jgi:hypothetical protein